MNNLNIDKTIGYVRKIVENIQCAICDKTDGQRLRYACGHTACDNCVIDAVDCQLCLTAPEDSCPQPRLDNALSERVKNTSELLKVCQDLFHTDVFKHKRLSEQLKIEKEVFPECIQAPVKYENKRKSTLISSKNKENKKSKFFPGEETSVSTENITMDSSANYVQQWLKNNEKDFTRKPFRDLNVNSPLQQNIILPKSNYKLHTFRDENVKTNRKRTHLKTVDKNTPPRKRNMDSLIYQHSKRVKKESHVFNVGLVKHKTNTECNNDESGIFMDDDPIVIDDSQETVVDKDKNAWLAVLKANENEEIESTSPVSLECRDDTFNFTNNENQCDGLQRKTNPNIKVPFYKKSYIIETCTYCNAADKKTVSQPEKVEITIRNADYTTTIKILKDVENSSKLNTTYSVPAQTDRESVLIDNIADHTDINKKDGREDVVSQKSDVQSVDLFEAESDSDMEMEGSGPVPVKVDVHRSCDELEYGVLSEIVKTQEHDTRPRRGPRGLTPTSTDSSDKENYNPNRIKKNASKKKKHPKK